MLHEFIVLALLMQKPAHGYLIAKVVNDAIGPYAKISSGRLYPLLAQLEGRGLIAPDEAAPDGPRIGRRTHRYQITTAGCARFRQLMGDTATNPGDYQRLFLQKMSVFGLIPPAERLRLLGHYRAYCDAHIAHLSREIDELTADPAAPDLPSQREAIVEVMRHGRDQWNLELAWVERLSARAQRALTSADAR